MIKIINAPNDAIYQCILTAFNNCISLLPSNFEPIVIRFCSKMRTRAGFARHSTRLIQLNTTLMLENEKEIIPTFLHELAHIIARDKHGATISAHGPEWRQVMRDLGQEPERCHNMDVSRVKRRWRRFIGTCQCENRQHIFKGKSKIWSVKAGLWQCRICQTIIKLGNYPLTTSKV